MRNGSREEMIANIDDKTMRGVAEVVALLAEKSGLSIGVFIGKDKGPNAVDCCLAMMNFNDNMALAWGAAILRSDVLTKAMDKVEEEGSNIVAKGDGNYNPRPRWRKSMKGFANKLKDLLN